MMVPNLFNSCLKFKQPTLLLDFSYRITKILHNHLKDWTGMKIQSTLQTYLKVISLLLRATINLLPAKL